MAHNCGINMSKIDLKLNKQFLSELTGSLDKSEIEKDKKLSVIFDFVNSHKKDNIIDVKEITDFANSIFSADTNNDGEVDSKELNAYLKANEDKFKNLKIKAKDIMAFLKTFAEKSDKTDEKNQRITNEDGSYSIIYDEVEDVKKFNKTQTKFSTIKVNYDKDNKITTTETTEGNTRTIKDKDGKVLTTQQLKDNVVVSEKKADGLTYYYDGNKTTIKNGFGNIVKEVETLESGKKIIREFNEIDLSGKTIVTTTNEETGEISKETIYEDGYYVKVRRGSVESLRNIKSLINNPISSGTFSTFDYMGKDAILALAEEDDINFQKTYITGMVDKIIEIAELTGEDSNEVKTIQKEIKEKGFENISIDTIHQAYSKLFEKIQKNKLNISESKISNKYYKSEHSYVKVTMDNKIVIADDKNNKTVIDKNKLLAVYSSHDKEVMWSVIKNLPAEALVDMAAEVSFRNVRESEGAAGSFNFVIDKINIDSIGDAETILHEMGHAIDCKGKGSENNYQTKHNAKFKQVFAEEMAAFEKAGNKRCNAYYDSKGRYHTKNDTLSSANSNNDSTYATVDEQEMFAECYALAMSGECQSEEVINKYFPKTLACVLEMIENTRKLPKSQRHN